MKYVTTEFHGRKVILLGGAYSAKKTNDKVDIDAPDMLLDVARRNPDAIAFGYIMGRWVAAA